MRIRFPFQFFFFLCCFAFAQLYVQAQAPSSISYQAIARDVNGNVYVNQSLKFKISIQDDATGSTVHYSEKFVLTTNAYGLVTFAIGTGSPLSGTFAAINWTVGEKWLKVEVDPTGGTNYVLMGTTQLLSVPFALFAQTAGG